MMQAIKTRTEEIWLGDDGIMRYKALPVSEHGLEDAKENAKQAATLSNGNSFPSIIDIRDALHISFEARKYYSGRSNAELVSACALLVDNGLSKIIGNFFLGLNRTAFPTEIFTSEEEAIQWLEQYKEI